ncbi:hypothetical protein [Chitinibacter sp. ZOR0017]|uniref:hypothetical protein n=1 Tax=Chitinibacter sp. ZOR0017 TaxID=1339254 RepID=UPI0009E0A188|nr:hypothetical protein [Chitinibacter sp. ZOR0017]
MWGRLSALGLLWLAVGSTALAAEPAPLWQESFEQSPNLPSDWQWSAWKPEISRAEISKQAAADGQQVLHLISSQPNHARLTKTIAIEPNRLYRFSAQLKAQGANADKLAAVLGVDGIYEASETVRAADRWYPRELYIRSNDASAVTVSLGLGHFGNENQGEAWFDAVSLTAVEGLPTGAKVVDLPKLAASSAASPAVPAGRTPWLWLGASLLALGGLIAAVAALLARRDQPATAEARE